MHVTTSDTPVLLSLVRPTMKTEVCSINTERDTEDRLRRDSCATRICAGVSWRPSLPIPKSTQSHVEPYWSEEEPAGELGLRQGRLAGGTPAGGHLSQFNPQSTSTAPICGLLGLRKAAPGGVYSHSGPCLPPVPAGQVNVTSQQSCALSQPTFILATELVVANEPPCSSLLATCRRTSDLPFHREGRGARPNPLPSSRESGRSGLVYSGCPGWSSRRASHSQRPEEMCSPVSNCLRRRGPFLLRICS